MSLKYKLPLGIFLIIALFIIIVFAYFRLYKSDDIIREINQVRSDFLNNDQEIIEGIVVDFPDERKIKARMESLAKERGISIALYDSQGKEIYFTSYLPGERLSFFSKNPVMIGGRYLYNLETRYPLHRSDFADLQAVRQFRNLIIAGLAAVVGLIILFIYLTVLKPLTLFSRCIDRVSYTNSRVAIPYANKDEIGELCRKFEEMAARVNDAYVQQNEMIAAISHDIRTPLTSISGYVERLLSKKIPAEKQKAYLSIIYEKASNIEELVQQLVDYAAEAGMSRNENNSISGAKELLAAVCGCYTPELKGDNITLECSCTANESAAVPIDGGRFRRVFVNLIENAVKYSERRPLTIKISCWPEAGRLFFSVADSGRGVPERELKRIFDKFHRLEQSRSREKGGTGLGLAICRSIIQNHGGAIWAGRSAMGGLEVTFYLPLIELNKS